MGNVCFKKRPVCTCKGLSDLPDEVILEIFTYLPTKDLGRCAMVSKRFKNIISTESLWSEREIPEKSSTGLDLLVYQYDRRRVSKSGAREYRWDGY